ncbi:hypothetical protein [Streptomyces sp. NPDC001833]|uniref:hypothetical protein n=1 Tax=Streptomyces sp. NPDC001833 TaxID=3154658 RepID=UPI00332ECCF2
MSVLGALLRDPALRRRQEGRQLLLLLQHNAVGLRGWADLVAVIPPHCRALIRDLACQYATTWTTFAEQVEERVTMTGSC